MVDQAEIHRKAVSFEIGGRRWAAEQLRSDFADLPDREEAWKDLHRLTQDKDNVVRWSTADALGSAFPHVPDKEEAWKDLHQLTQDENGLVRWNIADALGSAFPHVPDKEEAWKDLHQLTHDEDSWVQSRAARALGSAFPHVPDKEEAWEDLHQLTQDKDNVVRWSTAGTLGSAFQHVPDKEEAWEDLHRLTQDESSVVRMGAAGALGSAFQHVPDKEEAWKDLIQLTQDKDGWVRRGAAVTLGSAFPHIPDKEEAWKDLIQLTQDEDRFVRWWAADALGSAFQHVPDKEEAWKDLHHLTQDEDGWVRSSSHYSIGRINILKASGANENEIKKYLDTAIENFEKSIKDRPEYNPAVFCTLFYKSYSTILFKPEQSESEAKKFIEEAKKASEGSESKAELLEAVENLASSLIKADRYTTLDERQRDLRAHQQHLDRVAEIIEKHRQTAPGVSKMLERGKKIAEERINALILEIQEKAEETCQKSKGTPAEELACALNQDVQQLQKEQAIEDMEKIIITIDSKLPKSTEYKKIRDKMEELRSEKDVNRFLEWLSVFIAAIPTMTVHIGDTITQSNVTASEKSQITAKGDENKNIDSSVSHESNASKKSLIDQVNAPATLAALSGFLIAEIGTYFYPITYNHLISVFAAVLMFVLVALFNKR